MKDTSRDIVKARCDNIGMVMRLLFWICAALTAVSAGMLVWMITRPAAGFTLRLLDTGNGLAGFCFYNGGWEIDLPRDMAAQGAVSKPKLVYLLAGLFGLVRSGFVLAILFQLRGIFRSIDLGGTPFLHQNVRAVFGIGCLLIARGCVNGFLMASTFSFLRLGGGADTASDFWSGLLLGAVVICVSYLFDYGAVLQTQSDETL